MACYQIRTYAADLKVANYNVLKDALIAANWAVRDYGAGRMYAVNRATGQRIEIDTATGTLRASGSQEAVDALTAEVKRLYTQQAVKVAARRANLAIRQKGNQLTLTRR